MSREYFISYTHTSKSGFGFGSVSLEIKGKINADKIKEIVDFIYGFDNIKELGEDTKIVLLNIIKLDK
jgi:hypothetical protein